MSVKLNKLLYRYVRLLEENPVAADRDTKDVIVKQAVLPTAVRVGKTGGYATANVIIVYLVRTNDWLGFPLTF